jgi:hypothetical protein
MSTTIFVIIYRHDSNRAFVVQDFEPPVGRDSVLSGADDLVASVLPHQGVVAQVPSDAGEERVRPLGSIHRADAS